LNTLIPSSSEFYLWAAEFISDSGEIAALGLEPSGDSHALLLIPCDDDHPGVEGCDYSMVDASTFAPILPAQRVAPGRVPHAVLRHRSNRFHSLAP
jgi:hypothetical protein